MVKEPTTRMTGTDGRYQSPQARGEDPRSSMRGMKSLEEPIAGRTVIIVYGATTRRLTTVSPVDKETKTDRKPVNDEVYMLPGGSCH
jgi:hypothetical protein